MLKLDVKSVDGVIVATIPVKHIASDDDVQQISLEIKSLLSSTDSKRFLLNMERVESMASLMVGELILLQKVFKKDSAMLRLCSLNPLVVESLQISGICDLLDIDDNQEAALANLKA